MGEEKLQHWTGQGTLAIDLGSTTTVVAFQNETDPKPHLLDLPPITRRPGEVPSLVWSTTDPPLIGHQVIEAGLADQQDERLARDFKREIGETAAGGRGERAGETLLAEIWQRLPRDLHVTRLVLSAPVERYRSYRQWLLAACETLPVQDIALVDEPTAAAMGAGMPAGARLLVVDLGGSTLDLALVALEGGEGRAAPIAQLLRLGGHSLGDSTRQKLRTANVLGKAGLRLGGRDIDRWIAARCCPACAVSVGLLDAAERLKCRLSEPGLPPNRSLQELWRDPLNGQQLSLEMSRQGLDALLDEQGLGDALNELLETTLTGGRSHSCDLDDLQGVVAVGGGALLPWLQDWLDRHTAPAPRLTPPPVEAVALGALQLTPDVNVRDVLNRGVSLRIWDRRSQCHRWHPLFLAGQPWPSREPLELRMAASRENQQELELVLGEPSEEGRHEVVFVDGLPILRRTDAAEVVHQPWSEPAVMLPLDPPGNPGEDCLLLRLSIDAQARLEVEIRDLRSGLDLPSRLLGSVR